MTSCKLALFVLIFIATACFPSPVFSASWEKLGDSTSTSGNAYPGARYGAATWKVNETFWMFSGTGKEASSDEGYLSSLYKYNSTTSKWTLVSGLTSTNNAAVYPASIGGKGFPGGRYGAAHWADAAGNLWLFGGNGIGSESAVQGLLNDLWKYTPAKDEWTYYGGNKVAGSASADTTRPTPRVGASHWVDVNGNMWIFGGHGMAVGASTESVMLTDMWYWAPSQSQWNSITVDATPASRIDAACWSDAEGNGWIYGGRNADSNLLSDLWQFKVSAMEWAIKSGTPNINQNPTYPALIGGAGTPGGLHSASTFSLNGGLYLFGGSGLDNVGAQGLNRDVWKFNATTLTWAFLAGTPGTRVGSATTPGARYSTAAVGISGDLYVFGGNGYEIDGSATTKIVGDFWRISACGLDNTCVTNTGNVAAETTGAASDTLTGGGSNSGSGAGNGTTSGGSTTGGSGGVITTVRANITFGFNLDIIDPANFTSDIQNSLISSFANSLGVPRSYVSLSGFNSASRKRASFTVYVTIIFPNSSAIAAVTGGSPTGNMTEQLAQLATLVSNAANSSAVNDVFASAGAVVSSISAPNVESETVTVPSATTGPNWPYTTGGYNAGLTLTPSSLLLSSLLVFATAWSALL